MPCSPPVSDEPTGREANPAGPARKAPGGPAGRLPPGLYLVATPIGNARDITLRALDILAAADLVACEDTRVTRRLLQIHGLKARLAAYHDHNAERMRPKLIAAIRAGKAVALASDAGMPLVSDPGFGLARAVRAEGLAVTSAPGRECGADGPPAFRPGAGPVRLPGVPAAETTGPPARARALGRNARHLAGL